MCVSNVTLPYTKYVNFKLNFNWKDLCVCVVGKTFLIKELGLRVKEEKV
jgi:hypothetical protein